MPAPGASVTADRDQQRRGTPAQRLVRQATRDGVARRSLAAAPAAPLIRLSDPAGQDRAVALEALPDNLKAKLIQPGECGQVRANEGNVRHVEVFPIGSVRTPIIGRPRPLPSDRHAHHHYTLDCEEPPMYERFTPLGRRAIVIAGNLATQAGAELALPKHLLLALMAIHEGMASQALGHFDWIPPVEPPLAPSTGPRGRSASLSRCAAHVIETVAATAEQQDASVTTLDLLTELLLDDGIARLMLQYPLSIDQILGRAETLRAQTLSIGDRDVENLVGLFWELTRAARSGGISESMRKNLLQQSAGCQLERASQGSLRVALDDLLSALQS